MPNTWIFQGNPDHFDIDGYMSANLDRITWSARQRAADMAPGDTVYLWKAAGSARSDGKTPTAMIIAKATVMSDVWQGPDHDPARAYWKGPGKVEKRVWLRVEQLATPKAALKKHWLADDPVCHDLLVMRQRNSTNYLLPSHHADRLHHLWSRVSEDWDHAECIAALVAYHRTYPGPISKLPGHPVANTSLLIGRVVSGVYNKLLNFRHLDPRDDRAGFSGGGEMTVRVWDEFYDQGAEELDWSRLELAYLDLWHPTSVEPPSPSQEKTSPPEPSSEVEFKSAVTIRRVRDSRVSTWVKVLYDHRCQVCGLRLVGPNGVYAEGAHIRPLGRRHSGPDSVDNVLCLCPNHHVLLDLGAITLGADGAILDVSGCGVSGKLRVASEHELNPDHFAYHRRFVALVDD